MPEKNMAEVMKEIEDHARALHPESNWSISEDLLGDLSCIAVLRDDRIFSLYYQSSPNYWTLHILGFVHGEFSSRESCMRDARRTVGDKVEMADRK